MSKKEDRIREAANLHVKIGQLQRYCELMVELGEVRCRRNFSVRDEGKGNPSFALSSVTPRYSLHLLEKHLNRPFCSLIPGSFKAERSSTKISGQQKPTNEACVT